MNERASGISQMAHHICERLKVSAIDVEKVQQAKELLLTLQSRKAFNDLLGKDDDDDGFFPSKEALKRITSVHSLRSMFHPTDATRETDVQLEDEYTHDSCDQSFDEERWGNYFTGFQILSMPEGMDNNENRKCIELSTRESPPDLQMYLRKCVCVSERERGLIGNYSRQ